MKQEESDKKNFLFSRVTRLSESALWDFVRNYDRYFRVYRYHNTVTALHYIEGLLVCERGKANMERMEEEVEDSEYRAYQHFITNSHWDDA